MDKWLNDIMINIIVLLLNPLAYWIIFLILFSSYRRIKEERKLFGKKIKPHFSELKHTILHTVCFGTIISIMTIFLIFPLQKK